MTLTAGTKLGPYEILAPLGAGGMGEVYRTKDVRVDRTVALKVLPQEFFENKDSIARFEREARMLASLNHPHIAHLYSFEEIPGPPGSPGRHLLVMELADGQTLAERLLKGPLPLDQMLKTSVEIASALEFAHKAGIVHRDLKPGNIMLTKSGVKLLDFGLAKAAAAPLQSSGSTSLPTEMPKNLTQQGTILGTFQYMAPEQLEGKEADARSDIFAFGAVLYEMATGQKAFEAKSQASLIAAILKTDPPPVSTIQPMTPPALDRVVRTCLAKDPDERWQNAHDLTSELQWIAQGGSQAGVAAPVATSRRRRDRMTWGVAGFLAGAVVAAVAVWALARGMSGSGRAVTRVAVTIPPAETLVADNFGSIAISPDGRQLVYVAKEGDKRFLFRRAMDAVEPVRIAGTEGAFTPFFSPDGQWVGFWADARLRKVPLTGGSPVNIAAAGEPLLGASWGADDAIVYPKRWAGGLARVPAAGGKEETLTQPAAKGEDRGHMWPELLPGGKAVLFSVFTGGALSEYAIAARSLVSGEQKVLVKGGTGARYVATGHIVYSRGGALFAVPFDAKRLEVTGTPFPVAEGVAVNTNGGADFAVSKGGTLVYVPGGVRQQDRSLVWVTRKGEATPISAVRRPYSFPRLSPDGRRIAVIVESETYDVWLLDVERDRLTRFSFGKDEGNPVWSPDGKRLVYQSSQNGPYNLYVRAADGSGTEQRLRTDVESTTPFSWSPDGRLLAVERRAAGIPELWLYPFEKDSAPRPFLQTGFRFEGVRISPDGRWVAYSSNESGASEVYVTTFPEPGGKWQISNEGGERPLWSPDSKEIFYRKDRKAMRVAVTAAPEFSASRPELLFEGTYGDDWDIATDGKRFVMIRDESAQSAPRYVNVALDWFGELRARAAGSAR